MSYQIGIDTINLKPTKRLAHTEYCSNADLIAACLPKARRRQAATAGRKLSFNDAWQLDLIWSVDDGPRHRSSARRGRGPRLQRKLSGNCRA